MNAKWLSGDGRVDLKLLEVLINQSSGRFAMLDLRRIAGRLYTLSDEDEVDRLFKTAYAQDQILNVEAHIDVILLTYKGEYRDNSPEVVHGVRILTPDRKRVLKIDDAMRELHRIIVPSKDITGQVLMRMVRVYEINDFNNQLMVTDPRAYK